MKRALLVIAGIVLLTAIGLMYSWRDNQPSYQGRSLGNWLRDYGSNPIGGGLIHDQFAKHQRDSSLKSPAEAIRAMGTNTMATLLIEIKCPDEPPWIRSIQRVARKQSWLKIQFRDSQSRREQAALAFFDLGTAAAPAIPELAPLLTNYASSVVAAHALAGMGTNAIPAFTSALADSSTWIRDCGAWGLAQIGAASRDAVPQILQVLPKGNSADQMLMLWALGEIHEPVEIIRAELTSQLKNSDAGLRKSAAQALSKLGPDATPAVEDIKAALDTETDTEARAALKKLIMALNPNGDAPSQPAK